MSSQSTYSGNFKRRRSNDMEKREDDAMSTLSMFTCSWDEMSTSTAAATELSPPTSQLSYRRPDEDVLKQDTYFMTVACLSAERSKDVISRDGAAIVKGNNILGIGEDTYPDIWAQLDINPQQKQLLLIPAAENAVINTTNDLKGASIYLRYYPCPRSAHIIIQSGITNVIFLSKRNDELEIMAERCFEILQEEHLKDPKKPLVTLIKLEPERPWYYDFNKMGIPVS